MPRRARLMLPGVAIDAIQRGNNRSTCFFDEEDRVFHLFHLGRLLPRAHCRLHAYCLMDNHVHLLLTATHARLVQSEDYVLDCHRYIELNPVRAGLARRADVYPWSSYRANGKGDSSELLSWHEEYIRLGRSVRRLGSASFKRTMARVLGHRVEPGDAGRPIRRARLADQPDLLAPK